MKIALIGCLGFVGSAFSRLFEERGIDFSAIHRGNYESMRGRSWDVVIHAASNSRKFVADKTPLVDLEISLECTLRMLMDFPSRKHILLSTVDVYNDLGSPKTTCESTTITPEKLTTYGFHKFLSEQLVRRHSPHALIFRLAGMVGPGLKKNPVFDITNRLPLRIHPESKYQFLHTDTVAETVWDLHEQLAAGVILNVCGRDLVSPREIAAMAGVDLDLSKSEGPPRIVDISVEKLSKLAIVPTTADVVRRFVEKQAFQPWS